MENSPVRLFASDLDGTLLGNPEATNRFKNGWLNIPEDRRPKVILNSGRSLADMIPAIEEEALPSPDFLIGGLGTEICSWETKEPIPEYKQRLSQGWDLGRIEEVMHRFAGASLQPEEFQTPFKSSWFWDKAEDEQIEELRQALVEDGLKVEVSYESLRFLNVLPSHTNKGAALQWLCERLEIPLDQVLVAGDSATDSPMFQLPGVRGIVVENAQPELYESVIQLPVYCSMQILGDGIVEGLQHYGLIDRAPDDGMATQEVMTDPTLTALLGTEEMQTLAPHEVELIATGYEKALVAIRKCICEQGFLACSMEDNEVTGTDENYRSIWGRDASITIVNTIFIDEPDVRAAQRASLCTLLDHLTPTGQVPSNVSVVTGKPDYSGVGGICSIDSGLWLIIAFYNYVRVTKDFDLLREYEQKLQRAMDWLAAHDSNNDGLLEIPEAGDWTDLFGRSYNVLYDEILWYRANVAYARMQEFLGNFDKASDYLKWANHIKAEILLAFWPSTQKVDLEHERERGVTFADQQFTVGDAQYLLAQVSPFSFSWRCDVFGNVLAFLTNVLDQERARTAFKFMWGVGVNDPYPVANLYPVVQAGDPDWKSYYIVNFLNLPGHYHNGGIWPMVGGLWVRFINRLGLRDVACRELYKLAELNRAGTKFEWEFNEWAHNRTGRPMGKRFQAWSAAAFLRACHELQMEPDDLEDD